MTLLKHQADIGNQNPMPTDRVDDASTVNDVAAEVVTWFFLDTGAWASATGEAAGTLVWGKTDFDGILNSNMATLGSFNNTSIVPAVATRMKTLVTVSENVFAKIQSLSPTDQAAEMAIHLTTNGEYAIDHRRGQIWCLMLATVADDTMAYSYKAPVAGGGGPTADVDIVEIGGVAVPTEDAAVKTTGIHPLWESKVMDGSALPNQTNEGDAARPAVTLAGIPFGFATNLQGTGTPAVDHGTTIANGLGLTTFMQGFEAKDYDESALPNATTEGKAVRGAATLSGVSFAFIVNEDGSLAAIPIADDAADSGGSLKTGGVYNSTESSLDDGDRGDTQMDAEGYTKIRSKAYDTSSQADKSVEQAPIYTKNIGDTLVDDDSLTTNTTAYVYLDMAGYKYFTMQCDTEGTTPTDVLTLTVEASWQDDETAQASCTYVDVTNEWFGVASKVDTDVVWENDTPCTAKYVRLKYVTSNGAANDAGLTVYARRQY